jgi:hypothetical protein
MSKEVIMENEFICLSFHPEKKVIHHEVKTGFVPGEVFKNSLIRGNEVLKLKRATRWFSDNRKSGPVDHAVEEWINTVWVDTAVKAGWKYWALILPATAVGKMNMQRFAKSFASKGAEVQVFTDPDVGMKWLEERP